MFFGGRGSEAGHSAKNVKAESESGHQAKNVKAEPEPDHQAKNIKAESAPGHQAKIVRQESSHTEACLRNDGMDLTASLCLSPGGSFSEYFGVQGCPYQAAGG